MPIRHAWQGAALRPELEAPTLARHGNLFVVSSVAGVDARTGQAPLDPQAEFDLAFHNFARLLSDAGVRIEDVGLVNVWIAERALRSHIDSAWQRVFHGPLRPARKTNETPLDNGARVQLQAVGRSGATLSQIDVPGIVHRSPLPAAARLDSWVFSSVIGGENLQEGALPADSAIQIINAFANVRATMEAAGGDAGGVNHMWVFLSDMALNRLMLDSYLAMFPQDGDRPARKTVPYALPPGAHIQVQFTGDIAGRQANFEVPGVAHHDPIPLASCAGGLLMSSGVHGVDAKTSKIVSGGIVAETDATLQNIEAMMEASDAGLENIAGLTLLVRDYAFAPIVRAKIEARFGVANVPALQFANYRLPGELNVQAHVLAAV